MPLALKHEAFNHEDHEALALKHSITKYKAFNRDLRDKMLRALWLNALILRASMQDHKALALKHKDHEALKHLIVIFVIKCFNASCFNANGI